MNDILKKEKKAIIFVLLATLFLSLVFQYSAIKNIIFKVYKWQIVQPETVNGIFEMSLISAAFVVLAIFAKKSWCTAGITIISVIFLYLHGVLPAVILGLLYFEAIISLGRFSLNLRNKKERNDKYLEFFLIGFLIWCFVSIVCSLLGKGSFNDLRIVTVLLFLLSFVNGFNMPFFIHLLKKFTQFNRWEKIPSLFLLTLILIQSGKANTLLAYEFDSIWYGLRPEAVLVGNESFYDNLGMVSYVHLYPKLFELFLIPLSNLGSYSYIIIINVIFYALLIYMMILMFRKLNQKTFISLFYTSLIATIPVVSNMASTAKTDMFSTFMIILSVYFFWNWIVFLGENGNRDSSLFWFSIISMVLSLGGKPTNILYVPFVVLGLLVYMLLNKSIFQLKGILKTKQYATRYTILFTLSILVLAGVYYRTYKIVGVPIYPTFGNIWEILGFRVQYPYALKNVGETAVSLDVNGFFSRWFHLLFDPQPYGHVIMLWIGNLLFFLILSLGLLCLIETKVELRKDILVLITPLCLVGGFYATVLPNGGDSNFYLVPLILGTVGVIHHLTPYLFRIKKILFISLVLFIPVQTLLMFVSHPSWSYGMSPIKIVGENNTERSKSNLFEYNGIAKIEGYLKNSGSMDKCIGLGDDYLLNQLSCRMETVNASASDYLGNSQLFSSVEELKKFIEWSNTKYIIIPNSIPNENQSIYIILKELHSMGYIVADSKYDLIVLDRNYKANSDTTISDIQPLQGWFANEGSYNWIGKTAKARVRTGTAGLLEIKGIQPGVFDNVTIKVFADDKLITQKTVIKGEFEIKHQLDTNDDMILKIEVDKGFIPKEKGMGEDIRELSIMINSLTIS
ncbi:hypothetical protein [Paenibacillus aquistagni]|uniref:Uncharacterized protein n=1 Tax=Paenibacillus aquistagni TaxID=1852522 RepID=A0A1X7L006_9BACL|nr:hypothetical protein [Paenibacillus aquistagni]SMG46622.1 hypothetical protein SAMN06295960_2861 [Paenibacillus aquistagni]